METESPLVIETSLSAAEVRECLSAAFGPRARKVRGTPQFPAELGASSLAGSVRRKVFTLRHDRRLGALLSPIATGKWKASPQGTLVRVDLSPAPIAWMAPFGIALTVALIAWRSRPTAPLALWIFAIMVWSLLSGLWIAKQRPALIALRKDVAGELNRLLEAEPSTVKSQAKTSHGSSMIMRLWFPDSEPPERNFNLIAIVSSQLVGILGVITWLATLGACSNAEFKNVSYSCPSGTRIGVTWLLLAYALGTFFLSRFLIARRLRKLYRPLLATLVLAGLALGVLLVHHPNWGVTR